MTTESLEELRERLLQQDGVQRMIQMRAYEIYQMRGCQPGGEAHDWFHAEGEVLAFLIASESTRADEPAITGAQVSEISEPAASNDAGKKRIAKPRSRNSSKGTQTTRQSTASKRAATKKSAKLKTRPVRPGNSSKQETTE